MSDSITKSLVAELNQVVPPILAKAEAKLAEFTGGGIATEKKGTVDFVTAADRASEELLCESLAQAFPNIAIIAEEGGAHEAKGKSNLLWYIDPLDGTTNFAHNFPIYAISVGLCQLDSAGVPRPVYGFISIPGLGARYQGGPDFGSQKNGQPIKVTQRKALADSLAVTGLPYNRRKIWPTLAENLQKIVFACRGVRRTGSACSDLCLLAEGAVDLYYEAHLSPWDLAAGTAIAMGAGAKVTDFKGDAPDIRQGNIIAASPSIHSELMTLGLERG